MKNKSATVLFRRRDTAVFLVTFSIIFATTFVGADAFLSNVAAAAAKSSSNTLLKEASSYLDSIPMGPPDAILGIAQAFKACDDPRKVNVCVGAYRDANGKPWILPSVREAEKRMINEASETKEYLPIEGDTEFIQKALEFAYGSDTKKSLAGVQTLSGTGACRVGGAFLSNFISDKTSIYIPVPTWGNHWKIMSEAGLNTKPYRYYSRETNGLDYDGMIADLREAPDGSIILLHACAHNPTGCDPSNEQWNEICSLLKEKKHTAFFDSAYQGFASGDSERDAYALRLFVENASDDIPVMLAQSFAKNFGLYGERCGTFSVVCSSEEQREKIMSQLRLIIRPMYSNPPKHGSSIVKTVLSDEKLTEQYYEECKSMANRIAEMRSKLVQTLKDAGSRHDWSHVQNQIGMFAYTGMNEEMCRELTDKYAIFLTLDGRISVAGLNSGNVEYVAKAIHDITDGKSIKSTK